VAAREFILDHWVPDLLPLRGLFHPTPLELLELAGKAIL
jgi:hypothetical protein